MANSASAEEEGKVPPGSSGTAPAHEIENGVFNLVIAYVRNLETRTDPGTARTYVAAYLDRLADGLRASTQTPDPSDASEQGVTP